MLAILLSSFPSIIYHLPVDMQVVSENILFIYCYDKLGGDKILFVYRYSQMQVTWISY